MPSRYHQDQLMIVWEQLETAILIDKLYGRDTMIRCRPTGSRSAIEVPGGLVFRLIAGLIRLAAIISAWLILILMGPALFF